MSNLSLLSTATARLKFLRAKRGTENNWDSVTKRILTNHEVTRKKKKKHLPVSKYCVVNILHIITQLITQSLLLHNEESRWKWDSDGIYLWAVLSDWLVYHR